MRRFQVFTPKQAARICGLSVKTINKAFDSGRLMGYRCPGSPDRRIPEDALAKFMLASGMKLGRLAEDVPFEVLCVSDDPVLAEELGKKLPDASYRVSVAASSFGAGFLAVRPDVAVVDYCIGRDEAKSICKGIRKNTDVVRAPVIIAVLPAPEKVGPGFKWLDKINTFRKPVDAQTLADHIQGAL